MCIVVYLQVAPSSLSCTVHAEAGQWGRHSSCGQQNAALRCQSRGLRMASLSTLSARSLTIPFSLLSLITPFNLIPSLFYQYLRDNINTSVSLQCVFAAWYAAEQITQNDRQRHQTAPVKT